VATDRVELIRSGYEGWNRGDDESLAAALADDVELHGHPRLPEPGPHVGRDTVRSWLADLRVAWEEISIHPLAFTEAGDDVVVLINITGRGKGSGVEVRSGVDAHVWTFAEDGQIVRMRWIQGNVVAQRIGVPPSQVQSTVDEAPETLARLAEGEGEGE
jgi:ketosteroid isomerase-like protein